MIEIMNDFWDISSGWLVFLDCVGLGTVGMGAMKDRVEFVIP